MLKKNLLVLHIHSEYALYTGLFNMEPFTL